MSDYDLDELIPDMVRAACAVTERGWPVLPIRLGTKKPLHSGSVLPNHGDHWLRSAEEVILCYFSEADPFTGEVGCQFAVMTGVPNADGECLACLDADVDGQWSLLDDLLAEAGPEVISWAGETLRVQRSADRAHLCGTVPVESCPPTTDLADGIEWRGLGGYVLLPGARHPSGERYRVTRPAPPRRVPAALLHRVGRQHRVPVATQPQQPAPPLSQQPPLPMAPSARRSDAFQLVVEALRSAGRLVRLHDGEARARCPGPEHDHGDPNPSLSVSDAGDKVVLACHHEPACAVGDVVAALGLRLSDLFDIEPVEVELVEVEPEPVVAEPEPVRLSPAGRIDFGYLKGRTAVPSRPKPSILLRDDGLGIFYRGLVNNIYGPQEVGKTWAALAATAEQLLLGGRASWIDLDYMGQEAGDRLALLGVPIEILVDTERWRAYAPGGPGELMLAVREVVGWGSELNTLDAISGLLPMLGLKSIDSDDFTRAWRDFVVPLAGGERGRTALTLDHTAKDASVLLGPSGTAAKGRPTRGAQIGVPEGSFAPGRGGRMDLVLFKDTYGGLREDAERRNATKYLGRMYRVGRFVLDYQGPTEESIGSLSWHIEPPPSGKAEASVRGRDGREYTFTDEKRVRAEQLAAHVAAHPGVEGGELDTLFGDQARYSAVGDRLVAEQPCGAGCQVCPPGQNMRGRWRTRHYFPFQVQA